MANSCTLFFVTGAIKTKEESILAYLDGESFEAFNVKDDGYVPIFFNADLNVMFPDDATRTTAIEVTRICTLGLSWVKLSPLYFRDFDKLPRVLAMCQWSNYSTNC